MCWGRETSPPVSCLILSFLHSTSDLLSQLCHEIGGGGYSISTQKLEQPNMMIRFHLHCTWNQFILTNLPAATVIETQTSPPSPNTRDILTSIFCMSPSVPSHKIHFLDLLLPFSFCSHQSCQFSMSSPGAWIAATASQPSGSLYLCNFYQIVPYIMSFSHLGFPLGKSWHESLFPV